MDELIIMKPSWYHPPSEPGLDAVDPDGSHLEVVSGTSGHSLPKMSREWVSTDVSMTNCRKSTAVITKYLQSTTKYKSLTKHQTQIIIKFHKTSMGVPWAQLDLIFWSPCSLGEEGVRWWTQRLRCHGTCRWSCIHLIGDGCHSITTSISHGGNGIPSSAQFGSFN